MSSSFHPPSSRLNWMILKSCPITVAVAAAAGSDPIKFCTGKPLLVRQTPQNRTLKGVMTRSSPCTDVLLGNITFGAQLDPLYWLKTIRDRTSLVWSRTPEWLSNMKQAAIISSLSVQFAPNLTQNNTCKTQSPFTNRHDNPIYKHF